MEWSGSLAGAGAPLVGRFYIGDTIIANQIMVFVGDGGNATVGDPVSAGDISAGLGVNLSGALTYSTTIGSGGVLAEITYDPLAIIRGRASGSGTSGAAWVSTTDGNLLTQDTASATVLTDTAVGTSEFPMGYQVGLTGVNAGHVRVIDTHSDNTSQTVDDPFDNVDTAGDTYIRIYAPFVQLVNLTTAFDEFDTAGLAGRDIPNGAEFAVFSVWMGGHQIDGVISPNRTRNLFALVDSVTNPSVELEVIFRQHALAGNLT